MKINLLILLLFILVLISCNPYNGNIYKNNGVIYLENTSNDKVFQYTVIKTTKRKGAKSENILYETLMPGEYKRLGDEITYVYVAPEHKYRRDTLIGKYYHEKFKREIKVFKPFNIQYTGKMVKNVYPPELGINVKLKHNSESFLKLTDSINQKDTIVYSYLFIRDVIDSIIKKPPIKYTSSYKIKGSLKIK